MKKLVKLFALFCKKKIMFYNGFVRRILLYQILYV